MAEPRNVVITRTRRAPAARREFIFQPADLPASAALQAYRQAAWQVYQRTPLPVLTDDAWRRTDLAQLPVEAFRLPTAGQAASTRVPARLLRPLAGERHAGQAILEPGSARVELDPEAAGRGVVFTDLANAEREHPALLERLAGKLVRAEESKFAALAAALSSQGLLLYVPPGVEIEQPFHSLLWGPGVDLAHLTHLLVFLDEGASATLVHESASPQADGPALHAGLVEITIGPAARLKFVELQSWGRELWSVSHARARVERDGQIDWIYGAVGSRMTKAFLDLDLVGPGASGRMSGFYFADGCQHLDLDTQQNHLAPHTTSDLLFKGALKEASRSVWQGMIHVAPGAGKADGYQANRNLVLSPDARADSIPGLEILADDVRCTHGATVGQLEADPLFYLRSRGIPPAEAERLLVEGFFDPIMQRIPFEGVRARFQQVIRQKMSAD